MIDDFSVARASAHGSLGENSIECLNSNRRCCRLEFPVTPCKQTTARVSNRRKSAIFSFTQNRRVGAGFRLVSYLFGLATRRENDKEKEGVRRTTQCHMIATNPQSKNDATH